jgi:predicted HicB family RNase H-like nuclease
MTNVMTYKGYRARVEYDDGDGILFGRIAGIDDGAGFHADNVPALRTAFHQAVDDYLETCARIGKTPHKPYSGKLMLRVSPDLHAQIAIAAELQGKSINQLGEQALRKALTHRSGD